jgi:hypothetical protein
VDMDKMRDTIRKATLGEGTTLTLQQRIETKVETFLKDTKEKSFFVKRWFMPDEQEMTAISKQVSGVLAPAISESLSATVTDPNMKGANGKPLTLLSQKEYADAVSDKVAKDAWGTAQERFGDTLNQLSSDQKTKLQATLKQEIQGAVSKEYDHLIMASNAAHTQSMPKIPEGTIAGNVSGATNVDGLPAASPHTTKVTDGQGAGRS